MGPEQNIGTKEKGSVWKPLTTVTPLSKYLAMVLFIILPFVGGWIGYQHASSPEPDSLYVVTSSNHESSLTHQDEYSYEPGIPDAAELQELFAVYHDSEADIEWLHISESVGTIYFRVLTNGSVSTPLMRYQIADSTFYETDYRIDSFGGDRISPEGRFIAMVTDNLDPTTSVFIFDLEVEEEVYVIEVGSTETLWSELCGYAGPVFDLRWTGSATLQYGVHALASVDTESCERTEFLEYRTVYVEELL